MSVSQGQSMRQRRRLLAAASLIGLAAGGGLASSAAAQTGGDQAAVSEVVVTGSRIVRDGFQAPTPTTVLAAEDLQKSAPAVIADALNRLPQLGASLTPRTTFQGIGGGTGGANFLNARSLGANRTLTLLDGRRVVPSALTGAVDVNTLPTSLVQRVDVVTGGASAAYGSDAVAGVVNFVLDTKYRGIKGSVQAGITGQGDGTTYTASLAAGTGFAGGRGHILLSGDYSEQELIGRTDSRDWYQGYRQLGNPAFVPDGNQAAFIVVPNTGSSRATPGGLISAGPLKGLQFGPGGAVSPYTFSQIQSGNVQGGGGGTTPTDVVRPVWLQIPFTQYALFSRVSYDLTPSLNLYAEGSYGRSESQNFGPYYTRQGDITINSTNPYIPAALPMTGIASFSLGRTNEDLGNTIGENVRRMTRGVVGVDGRLPMNGRWGAYYQYGRSKISNRVLNNPIVANFNRATDVIRNPAAGGVAGVAAGTPICRSRLTDPNNGCAPFNPFGLGSPSAESVAYILGQASQNILIRQDVMAISGQIEPFSTWAGPVSVAGGYEYRRESYSADADPISASASAPFFVGNYKPGSGRYHVNEVFAETIVPLLKSQAFADRLDFNGAVRFTDYSTSGRVTTWKAGLTWDVTADLRLRGTRSRDIRAANLNEMFLGGQTNTQGTTDVLQPGQPNVQAFIVSGGNPSLRPEKADTLAYGVVYRPSWLPGLSGSIDYYSIEIEGAIANLGAGDVVNQCYGVGVPAVPSVCNSITLAAPNTLAGATIRTSPINLDKVEQAGIDFELGYRTDLNRLFGTAPGALDLRLVATNIRKMQQQRGAVLTDNLGTFNGLKWRGQLSATYTVGSSSTTLFARYVGPAVYNNLPVGNRQSVSPNRVPSRTYFDLSENFRFNYRGVRFTAFGVVENLFNRDPPVYAVATTPGVPLSYHDILGRTFRIGLRFEH